LWREGEREGVGGGREGERVRVRERESASERARERERVCVYRSKHRYGQVISRKLFMFGCRPRRQVRWRRSPGEEEEEEEEEESLFKADAVN